jgi:hypothetical protein
MPTDEVIVTICYEQVFLNNNIFDRNKNDNFWHKILVSWNFIMQKQKEVGKSSQPLFLTGA